MKKVLLKLAGVILFITLSLNIQAQVTIGSGFEPNSDAILDLKENANGTSSKGLLLPRVELKDTEDYSPLSDHIAGMFVFNTATAGTGATAVSPGTYYNSGQRWVRVNSPFSNWFYMPSTPINTETITPDTSPDLELDMYGIFVDQFTAVPATERSPGAMIDILALLPAANQFDYYITGYDNTVFKINEVTANGVLKYRIIGSATDATYINIVFVAK